MRILNLYAGLGGNRSGFPEAPVFSVEADPATADAYRDRFPQDTVLCGDALSYLEAHYAEYDLIWASPPCPTHGQYRHNVGVLGKGYAPVMPDMSLYAQIVFLKTYHKGLWCVENVIPYYTPLIAPTARVGRHLVWANFPIGDLILPPQGIRDRNAIADFAAHELVKGSLIRNKRQALRNLCDPRVGRHIYNAALAAKEGTRHGQE